jgi:kynurenine formamidase
MSKIGNWGRWGDDDERGALNLVTPDSVRRGAAAIRTGTVYSLGIPIQTTGMPNYDYRGKPMRLTLSDSTDSGTELEGSGWKPGSGAHEDVVVFATHAATHMDGLIHVFEDEQHYNGVSFRAMRAMTGATKLGIEKAGGFATRAVLLDMVRYFGADRWLEPSHNITGADLEGACAAQGVTIESGDVVLIRTGYLDMWFGLGGVGPEVGFPGIGLDGAQWLADRDVVAVGADNPGVECFPSDGGDMMSVHKLLIVRYGIYLLEFLDLAAPARDECWEGLLSVAPLKITGATGCPINPIYVG